MYLQDFFNKYNGKKVDFDGHYGAQCVDEFRQFNKEVLGIAQPRGVNGAKDFWNNYSNDTNLYNNFDKIANTPSFVPQFGDVAIWGNGAYGHIAICTGKGDVNKFESFDQNYPTGSACHYVTHNYSGFLGVLRPKAQNKLKAPVATEFKVRVDKAAANVRKEPKLSAPLAGSKVLHKGDVFVATEIVNGDNVNGNNKWYHSKVGNYVHSRGLTRI
jgi:hypothetical protein